MVEVQQYGFVREKFLTKCVLFVISFYALLAIKELTSIHGYLLPYM
jgi:hypothetical protein